MKRLLFSLVALVLVAGCSHGEESECTKYVSLLGGSNPKAVMDDVGAKKCQDAVDVFIPMLQDEKNPYKMDIMRVVGKLWFSETSSKDEFKVEFGKFEAKKAQYQELLKIALTDPQTAPIAAQYINDWGMKELRDSLIQMLLTDFENNQTTFALAYEAALAAVVGDGTTPPPAEYKNKPLDKVYVRLLTNSPDVQGGMEVNRYAAVALAKLKVNSKEAIEGLIRGVFLRSKDRKSIASECISALLAIGADAVPYLAAMIAAKPGDERTRFFEEFAVQNAISDWQWRSGMRVPMILAQLRHPDAVTALVMDIGRPIIRPAGLPNELQEEWTRTQFNRIKFASWGLRHTLTDEAMKESLRIMRNRDAEAVARFELSMSLAFYFTPKATDTLFNVVWDPNRKIDDEGEDDGVEKAQEVGMAEPARESDFVGSFLRQMALAVSYDDLARFEEIFTRNFEENFGDVEKSEEIAEKREEIDIKVLLQVVRACQKNMNCYIAVMQGGAGTVEGSSERFDPKMVDEYIEKAGDKGVKFDAAAVKVLARVKAALVLGRWKGKPEDTAQLLKLFLDAYKALPYDQNLNEDLRYAIYLGIERLAMSSRESRDQILVSLDAIIKAESGKNVDDVIMWNQRLESLKYYLENYTSEKYAPKKAEEKKPEEKKPEAKPEEKKPEEAPKAE